MKYSYQWLQLHIEQPLPPAIELEQAIIFHAFEVEEMIAVGDDTVMEIKVLPDRAGDCLSHFGMAREIAGLLGLTLKTTVFPLPQTETHFPVAVESPLCDRYMAIAINNVTVKPAPDWLRAKLEAIGQKSINNIVDATNFTLFDTGQPTHVFDADKVGGITVRLAHEGETVTTLSQESKVLKDTDLVIADNDTVLAIAGVKGGNCAEVSTETKNIILEIAHFDAIAVRKTSRRLGLITDASKRFENNLSVTAVAAAAAQLSALIIELAGGEVVALGEHYKGDAQPHTIIFSIHEIARVLGDEITGKKIAAVFDRYQYHYTFEDGLFTLNVPEFRVDLKGVHDVAEEIGRVIGYDTIAALPLPFVPEVHENSVDQSVTAIKEYLIKEGYCEVMTYSFRKKGDVSVAYGAQDKSALRSSLLEGLKESYEINRLNAPLLGRTEMKVFEVGTVFFAESEEVHVATVDKTGAREWRLADFVEEFSPMTHDVRLISEQASGAVAPFVAWSTYPFIVRDVSVWLPEGNNQAKEMLDGLIADFALAHAIAPGVLFDTFSKEGRTSYAYRFIFQSFTKTLTDNEVAPLITTLTEDIKKISGAEMR